MTQNSNALSRKVFECVLPLEGLKIDGHVGGFSVKMDAHSDDATNYHVFHIFRRGKEGTKWRKVSVFKLRLEFKTTRVTILPGTLMVRGSNYGTSRDQLERMVNNLRRRLVRYGRSWNTKLVRRPKGRK